MTVPHPAETAPPQTEKPAPRSAVATVLRLLAEYRCMSPAASVLLLLQMTLAAVLEVATLGAFVPFFAALVTDPSAPFRLVGSELTGRAAVLVMAALFLALVLVSIIFRIITLRRINRLSAEMGTRLLQERLDRLFSTELSGLMVRPLGEVMADATHRVNLIVAQVLQPSLALGANGLVMLAASVALFLIAPLVTACVIGSAVALYAIAFRRLHLYIRADGEAANNLAGLLLTRIADAVHGWVELVIYDRTRQLAAIIGDEDRQYRDAVRRLSDRSILPRFLIEGAVMTGLVGVSVFLARDGIPDRAVLVSAGAYLAILVRIVPLFQTVIHNLSVVQGALPALRSFDTDGDMPPPSDTAAPAPIAQVKRIDLMGVGFDAGTRTSILADVSYRFEQGRIHGISGRTGSGKTTLLLLIMGLLGPTRGRILYDGTELTAARRAAIRPALAYVGQRPILFRGTIRDNITLSDGDGIDAERLVQALHLSTLDDDIASGRVSLSDTLDPAFPVLSGGQQQRLNLARAIYQDRAVLILDEFTSALDHKTEEEILRRLAPYAQSRIIIMVSHRPGPLALCDAVLTLHTAPRAA